MYAAWEGSCKILHQILHHLFSVYCIWCISMVQYHV